MVVDARTGIDDIANDIKSGMMVLQGISTLLLLTGRADLLCNKSMESVLARLQEALNRSGFTGTTVIAGPLPAPHDKARMCQDLMKERNIIRTCLDKVHNVHFCDAGSILLNKYGVAPLLLEKDGLTLDGRRELQLGFGNV